MSQGNGIIWMETARDGLEKWKHPPEMVISMCHLLLGESVIHIEIVP